MNPFAQLGRRDYQLRGWAQALAWAELARDHGREPRAPQMVDELGELCDAPARDADGTALRPAEADGGVAAELWIEEDRIVWRRTGADARRVYDFEPYPPTYFVWAMPGWKLNIWNFEVREAQAVPGAG